MTEYDRRLREQVSQFEVANAFALPAIFELWAAKHVVPGMQEVFGVWQVTEFYAEAFRASAAKAIERPRFLSLGCGDGEVERAVAQCLLDGGLRDFEFYCYDLSPTRLERFDAELTDQLRPLFRLEVRDINREPPADKFASIMANHSLHHMVDLEGIFATAYSCLHDDGIFATNDMIGRNGHQRWPEAKAFVDFFWPLLRLDQRKHVLMGRVEEAFLDHDASTEGFEGIRSQDILPVLAGAGFHASRFLAFGGFIDPFVDRGFGHNFSVESEEDRFLIERAGWLNDVLLDAGVIKPTIMLGWFVKRPGQEINYRGRSTVRSMRDPAAPSSVEPPPPTPPSFVYRPVESFVSRLSEANATIDCLRNEVEALRQSASWRMTSPLRSMARALRLALSSR